MCSFPQCHRRPIPQSAIGMGTLTPGKQMNTPVIDPVDGPNLAGRQPAAAKALASPITRVLSLGNWKLPDVLTDVTLISAAALFIVLLVSRMIDLNGVHLGLPSFNDQVGYISVARTFVETGVLRSNIIYPSTLLQEATKNYFYMPGHYVALA